VLVCDRSRYDNALWSQFGLSILIDCHWTNRDMQRILFDTGWNAEPLLHNMKVLGITIDSIDTGILSHAHYDHTGGLPHLLGMKAARFQVVAHKEITRPVFQTHSGTLRYIGLEPANLWRLSQSRLILIEAPVELCPGVWVSGTIPRRTDFEKPEKDVVVLRDGQFSPDPERDDMAIVLDMGTHGIVVVTGCCHAGVVNTVKAAQEITENNVLYGLFGGFHLIDKPNDVINKTVGFLRERNVSRIWSGHCTGWEAETVLDAAFRAHYKRFYTGDKITITGSALEDGRA